MRARHALVLGALAYGAFLAGTLPASLLAARIEKEAGSRVAFDSVDGSVWDGRARVTLRPGGGDFTIDELRWRFLPSRLLMGEAAWSIHARRPGLDAAAVAARSLAETRFREVRASGTAGALVPLFPLASSWQPEGTVAIEADEFAFGGGEARGQAKVEWREAALSLAAARPLGSWKADLAGKGAAIEVALATVKGPLRLAGKGSLKSGSVPGFRFDGTASADPGREKELEALLALIGPRRPDGLHAITVR